MWSFIVDFVLCLVGDSNCERCFKFVEWYCEFECAQNLLPYHSIPMHLSDVLLLVIELWYPTSNGSITKQSHAVLSK